MFFSIFDHSERGIQSFPCLTSVILFLLFLVGAVEVRPNRWRRHSLDVALRIGKYDENGHLRADTCKLIQHHEKVRHKMSLLFTSLSYPITCLIFLFSLSIHSADLNSNCVLRTSGSFPLFLFIRSAVVKIDLQDIWDLRMIIVLNQVLRHSSICSRRLE